MRWSEDGARAGHAKARLIKGNRSRDLSWHWSIRGRAERTAEVANVTAHEDERCRCSACETGYVSNSVARHVKDVKATIAEEVIERVLADLVEGFEGDFMNCAASMMDVSMGSRHCGLMASLLEILFKKW